MGTLQNRPTPQEIVPINLLTTYANFCFDRAKFYARNGDVETAQAYWKVGHRYHIAYHKRARIQAVTISQ